MKYRFSTLSPLLDSDSSMRILFMFGFTHRVNLEVNDFTKHVFRIQLQEFLRKKLLPNHKLAFHNFDSEYIIILDEFRDRFGAGKYTDQYLESVETLADFGAAISETPAHAMIDRLETFFSTIKAQVDERQIVVDAMRYISHIRDWEKMEISPGLADMFAYSATEAPFTRSASQLLPLTCNEMGGSAFTKFCINTFPKNSTLVRLSNKDTKNDI